MKMLRFCIWLVLFPSFAWSSTHIINQSFFLTSKPDKTWSKEDTIVVLGAERVDLKIVARARKKFSKSTPVYWLLSDDQWRIKNINLDKDAQVLDFVKKVKDIGVNILPENLCPEPAVIHEKNYDLIVIDSSWILFQHEADIFKKECGNIDGDDFYDKIEQTIMNSRLKPVVILSYHAVHRSLVYNESQNPLAQWANTIQHSLGPIDSISNPAYQKYQEKMNKIISKKPNLMYVSSTGGPFFRDLTGPIFHVALAEKVPGELILKNESQGVQISSKEFLEPVQLNITKDESQPDIACQKFAGSMHFFKDHGSFLRYFLGRNYKKLWNQELQVPCFDILQKNLKISGMGESLRSPDFQLSDGHGNYFILRPLINEVRLPEILRETIVESIMLDLQSSINPVGYLMAADLSSEVGVPQEYPELVYVDVHQKAFYGWKVKDSMSGFYQFVRSPKNILNNPNSKKQGLINVISTREMVHHLEDDPGYRLDEKAYLKARLFDILIGDWDRGREKWHWTVTQEGDFKVLRPYPIDRQSAFYKGDGSVSWWRRRQWIDYKLQNYNEKLKTPAPMMIESMSMDYRFTSNLTEEDWKEVVSSIQEKLSKQSIEKTIQKLPVSMPEADQKWIVQYFDLRLRSLPQLAQKMRAMTRRSVDVVGTGENDEFHISTNRNSGIQVSGKNSHGEFFSNSFSPKTTDEIRFYGVNGDDDFVLNWDQTVPIRIRLVPGEGNDVAALPNRNYRPKMKIYDDEVKVDSSRSFHLQPYEPIYNDFYSHVNSRKLSFWTPVIFLASTSHDTGFTIGGGLKYNQAGFQKEPWASTNELKANAVLNRHAANVMYVGTWYDVLKKSDFLTSADAGLPRFYGNFFGLGNATPESDPAKPDSFYWLRAYHLETDVKLNVPVVQYFWVEPKIQFRFRHYIDTSNNFLTDPSNNLDTLLGPGNIAQVDEGNFYLGTGLTLKYFSDDLVSGPIKKRALKADLSWMVQKGFADDDSIFQTLNGEGGLTGFFQHTKTQWKLSAGFGKNWGNWEFFDAQFLGSSQNLRGFFTNRFAGASRIYSSLEINQSLMWKKNALITDYGLGGFFDNGRVFISGDVDNTQWHESLGADAWISILNVIAFKLGYAHPIFEEGGGLWSFSITTGL